MIYSEYFSVHKRPFNFGNATDIKMILHLIFSANKLERKQLSFELLLFFKINNNNNKIHFIKIEYTIKRL